MYLADNLFKIKKSIGEAATTAGRSAESVQLVAVSKTVTAEVISKMHALGQKDFAENRPQSLRDKARILKDLDINWHFIGPLQANKIKYVYPVVKLVHSVDRIELIEEFVAWHKKTGHKCPFLLQVHISGEESKQGFGCDEILEIIERYANSDHLKIRGLMGMAPYVDDEALVGGCFKKLADLFVASKKKVGSAYRAEELSIGMSGDFGLAIAEGATMVRIGTALFSEEG